MSQGIIVARLPSRIYLPLGAPGSRPTGTIPVDIVPIMQRSIDTAASFSPGTITIRFYATYSSHLFVHCVTMGDLIWDSALGYIVRSLSSNRLV